MGKKTIVIAGGTDGMGRAVALDRMARGDDVVVIGSSAEKGAAHPWRFVQADLSSVAEVRRVVRDIGDEFPSVNALLLTANRIERHRRETPEGLEATFALYYLSRYLLAHGLPVTDVIISVSAPGMRVGRIHWDDLRLTRRWSRVRAQLQAGRANDLLGVAFAEETGGRVPFVIYNPRFTATDGVLRAGGLVRLLARVAASPVVEVVAPLVEWIDDPPAVPFAAFDRNKPVDIGLRTFDPADARRLSEVSKRLSTGPGTAPSPR
ncbi:SDR family NAD(P)-dependent oxidoreductase [Lentzea tibetensis]|nr:SDR family NAD(P)-dependent oxidoreductase [Lentzea tibetensis]